MTCFSNNTEADDFRATWCARCRNWRDREAEGYPAEGEGCPVMDIHFTLASEDAMRPWLAMLIADTAPPGERRCHLFVQGQRKGAEHEHAEP